MVILIWNALLFKEPTFRDEKTPYPLLMQVCVVALVIILLMLLPLIGCHQVNRSNRGSFFTRLMASCKPVQREMPNIPLVTECDYPAAPENANQTLALTYIQTDKFSIANNAVNDAPLPVNRNYIATTQNVTGTSSTFKNSMPKVRKNPIAATIPMVYSQPQQQLLAVTQTDDSISTPVNTNGTTTAIVSADEVTFTAVSLPLTTATVTTTSVTTCLPTNGHTISPNSPIDNEESPLIRIPVTFSLIQKLDRETDL